eukprot:PhM_4_TR6874/c0_g1_i1/m.31434
MCSFVAPSRRGVDASYASRTSTENGVGGRQSATPGRGGLYILLGTSGAPLTASSTGDDDRDDRDDDTASRATTGENGGALLEADLDRFVGVGRAGVPGRLGVSPAADLCSISS